MNFSQGHLPSCQTLSAIGALSLNPLGRQHLQKMVSKVDDVYEVTFPLLPDKRVVVSPKEYATTGSIKEHSRRAQEVLKKEFENERYHWVFLPDRPEHVTGDELMRVLEIAYAKYLQIAFPERYSNGHDSEPLLVYRNNKFHYQADETLHDFIGSEVETLAAGESTSESSRSFAEALETNSDLRKSLKDKLAFLSKHLSNNVATACSAGIPFTNMFLDPGGKIQPWHDHIITAVNVETETIHLIDPYNSRITMILYWEDFFRYFYLIANAEVSG